MAASVGSCARSSGWIGRPRSWPFAGFLERRILIADQLEFVDLVIDHLTARGVMDPKLLYESPFTDFDSNGVAGVFEHADVVHLIQILREIEQRSAA
jgi:type I restriction enzyme R subunit